VKRQWRHLGLVLILLLAAAGCNRSSAPAGESQGESPKAGEPAADRLEVRDPRAVLTMDAGAVYFTVVNPGPQSDRLLRVETAMAQAAEPHESVEENGVVRMVARPEGFEIPAGGTLELAPGGKHIMLAAPKVPAGMAGLLPLTLHFEHAGAIDVQAALSPMDGMDHGGMDHGGMDHSGMDHGGMDHGEDKKTGGGS